MSQVKKRVKTYFEVLQSKEINHRALPENNTLFFTNFVLPTLGRGVGRFEI